MKAPDPSPVLQRLAQERLALDETPPGRTAFLSHLGAALPLRPGPWIGHRDLLYALALANLSPAQRESLARAILVEHDRPFGVGRLRLRTAPSGLPLGGALLWMAPRGSSERILYAWGLGPGAKPLTVSWLLLRAHPSFGLADPPPALDPKAVATAAALGDVLVAVDGAVTAKLVADRLRPVVPVAAHPRFAPHLDGLDPAAQVLVWPHDALGSRALSRRSLVAILLVDAPEAVRSQATLHAAARHPVPEVVPVGGPGRLDRAGLLRFVDACGRPAVCLRGDPASVAGAAACLRGAGVATATLGEAAQLRLL